MFCRIPHGRALKALMYFGQESRSNHGIAPERTVFYDRNGQEPGPRWGLYLCCDLLGKGGDT